MLHFPRDAVRIQVQKFGGPGAPASSRKFSVDPSLTSLEVLQSILTRAFDVKGDYALSYLAVDDTGEQTYLPLLSDWDLEAAFTSASDPCLHLILNTRSRKAGAGGDNDAEDDDEPRSNGNLALNSAEWDVVHSVELPQPVAEVTTSPSPFLKGQDYLNASVGIPADPDDFPSPSSRPLGNKLPGFIKNRVEKTYNNIVQGINKAFSLVELDPLTIGGAPLHVVPNNSKGPLSDAEFHSFLDPVGCLVHARELRHAVFWGGIEPSLRKVVWKHILNIYPDGMPGRQRMDYIKSLSSQYERLKAEWKSIIDMSTNVATPPSPSSSTAHNRATAFDQIVIVANMVRKDVLRTDRSHPFFAGPDDNPNIASLFNILTTFALNHPSVGYCQGMSDIAAPLLFVMRDEAQAYICFCALMRRLKPNFSSDGVQMAQLFAHLSRAVSAYDPRFYKYLCDQQADDLLFCYRWLLLELKREFCFEDALRMLEVSWSSFPDWNGAHTACNSCTETVTTSDGSSSDTPTSSESGDAQAFLPLFEKKFCVAPDDLPKEPSSSLASTAAAATATMFDRKQTAYARVRAMRRQSTHGATVASLRINSYRTQYQQQVSMQERSRKTASFESSTSSLEILATGEFECAGTARTVSTCSSSAANTSATAAAVNFIFNNGLSAPPSSSSPEIISSSEILSYSPYEIIPSPPPPSAGIEIGAEAEPSPPPPPPPPAPGASKIVRNLKEFRYLAKGKAEEELTNSSTSSTASSGRGFEASCESNSSSVAQGRKKVLKLTGKPNGKKFTISDDEDGESSGQLRTIDEHKRGSRKKDNDDFLSVEDRDVTTSSAASPSSSDSGLDDEDRAALIFSQNSCEEVTETTKMLPSASATAKLLNSTPASLLPPPDKLGCGHPFLVFLCLTLLLQHRDPVIKRGMDYNELAMYFDKMVRRHDVSRVLNQARAMYEQYLSFFASIGQAQAPSSSGASSTACELVHFHSKC